MKLTLDGLLRALRMRALRAIDNKAAARAMMARRQAMAETPSRRAARNNGRQT
jgi:hypothetical protein